MKRFLSLLTLLTTVALIFPVFAHADDEQTKTQDKSRILLVCDENNGRTRLEELIRACGKSVDAVSEADYRTSILSDYSNLVTTANEPYRDAAKAKIPTICVGENAGPVDGVDTAYIESTQIQLQLGDHTQTEFVHSATLATKPQNNVTEYSSIERINGQTFPFALIGNNAVYVPWYREDDLSVIMLGGLFRQYFDNTKDENGKMYVLLDEVYPFSDLVMLCQTADAFNKNGIPFIVRIMPVYDNLDYPAFQRYTQALLYVQSKGGSIVLHDPIVREYESERETLDKKMARAKTAFANANIILLDMDLPPLEISVDSIYSIGSIKQNFGSFPVDTMISFKLFTDYDELNLAVRQLNDKWLSLSSYKANYSIADSRYEESTIDVNFAYRTTVAATLKGLFSGVNRVLLIVVGGGIAAFLLLLLVGNRIYWSKFYKK